jgi:putative acetyltransferase
LIQFAAFTSFFLSSCDRKIPPRWVNIRSDRTVSSSSDYPVAIDPLRVGSYSPETKSGAGYFYDDVLEYRVWLHPEKGAQPVNKNDDYFVAFAQYERAETFAKSTPGSEPPLVLVRQLQWIDEPEAEHYVQMHGERITEWQVHWLSSSKRATGSIEEFMNHPRPARD